MTDLQWWETYFGDPWPSGVCEDNIQVPTPVGDPCVLCQEPIQDGDQGTFVGMIPHNGHPAYGPVHRECSLRSALGGIGHHFDHLHWCIGQGDPDAGHSYRESALMVWHRVVEEGIAPGED